MLKPYTLNSTMCKWNSFSVPITATSSAECHCRSLNGYDYHISGFIRHLLTWLAAGCIRPEACCSVLLCSVLFCSVLFYPAVFWSVLPFPFRFFSSIPLHSVLFLSVPFHPVLFCLFVINLQTKWRHVGTFVETQT